MSVRLSLAILSLLVGAAAVPPDAPHVIACPPTVFVGPGPLRLRGEFCVFGFRTGSHDGVYPSPDGDSVFDVHVAEALEGPSAVDVGRLEPGEMRRVPLAPASLPMQENPVAWSADSRFVWAAVQDRVSPGGWAAGPLRLSRIGLDGRVRPLPRLAWRGEPLDRIAWIGGDGLALAEFGTRGAFYRPAHPDALPTLAFVDVARGRVLQAVAERSLDPELAPGDGDTSAAFGVTSAIARPDGRLEAVFKVGGRWLAWTAGGAPRRLEFGDQREWDSASLTPDGRRLLVHLRLTAWGWTCEHAASCPAPSPGSGAFAILYDLGSGRALWKLSGTSTHLERAYAETAVSPEGDVALVAAPSDEQGRPVALLVSLKDGKVLQTLKASGPNQGYRAGFGAGGRFVWIRDREWLSIYGFHR